MKPKTLIVIIAVLLVLTGIAYPLATFLLVKDIKNDFRDAKAIDDSFELHKKEYDSIIASSNRVMDSLKKKDTAPWFTNKKIDSTHGLILKGEKYPADQFVSPIR